VGPVFYSLDTFLLQIMCHHLMLNVFFLGGFRVSVAEKPKPKKPFSFLL
jgi:hypothetical protein